MRPCAPLLGGLVCASVACATADPPRLIVRQSEPDEEGGQPLNMRMFAHLADDGTILLVGGPDGRSRTVTSRELFEEIELLAPRGLVVLYSVDGDPKTAARPAQYVLDRLAKLSVPSRLVGRPPGVASPYGGGATVLMAKAQAGDEDWVKDLLFRGADTRARDTTGRTALMYAASAGRTDIVRRLVQAGADANEADVDGSTPLMFAAGGGHTGTVQALIDAGARVGTRGMHGLTALDFADRGGHPVVSTVLRRAGP